MDRKGINSEGRELLEGRRATPSSVCLQPTNSHHSATIQSLSSHNPALQTHHWCCNKSFASQINTLSFFLFPFLPVLFHDVLERPQEVFLESEVSQLALL